MIVAGEVSGEEGDSVVGDNDGQTRAHVGGANRRRQDHNLRGVWADTYMYTYMHSLAYMYMYIVAMKLHMHICICVMVNGEIKGKKWLVKALQTTFD